MRLILVILCLLVLPVKACVLRMAAEADFPPHLIQTEDGWSGLSVELLQRLANEVDCTVQFVPTPWLRSLQLSETGQIDVVSHLSVNEKRKAVFAFIGPHHIENISLIGDPDKLPLLDNIQQLARTDIGTIATLHGGYYGEVFDNLRHQHDFASQLVPISSIQDQLALLRAGRVDAIMEDQSVLQYWQRHDFEQASQYQSILSVFESPVYFGFSKTSLSAAQIARLATTWQQLATSGQFDEIYRKYHITPDDRLTPAPVID